MMLYETQYSIIDHIRKAVPEFTEVVWVYDGLPNPGESSKPYCTVDNLFNDSSRITKDMTAQTIMRFQIGVYGRTNVEHIRLVDKMRKVFLFDKMTYYDLPNDVPTAAGEILVDIFGETRIHPENIDEVGDYHKTYFDIGVSITHNK